MMVNPPLSGISMQSRIFFSFMSPPFRLLLGEHKYLSPALFPCAPLLPIPALHLYRISIERHSIPYYVPAIRNRHGHSCKYGLSEDEQKFHFLSYAAASVFDFNHHRSFVAPLWSSRQPRTRIRIPLKFFPIFIFQPVNCMAGQEVYNKISAVVNLIDRLNKGRSTPVKFGRPK